MIFTSVDVEALRYLRATGNADKELEKFLLENISFGYQRELTYRHRDGWFNAHVCDSETGSLWLTAYCLTVFSQARSLVTIDTAVLDKAARWILDHQRPDGGWEPVGWVHNSNLYGGYSGNFALTAFVTIALKNYGAADTALAGARQYLEEHIEEAETSHSLAVGAYALALLGSPAANQALTRLEALAKRDESQRPHWEPSPVETTGYAALALIEGGRIAPASGASAWLATQRNAKGGFGNTQDTVLALRALVRNALLQMESTDVDFRLGRGEETIGELHIDGSNINVVHTFTVEAGGPVSASATGKGIVSIQMAKLYNLPTKMLQARGGLELVVDYETTRISLGDTVRADAKLSYDGSRPETNMTIAEIGIPTGLRPDRDALNDLVGKGAIKRIDVKGRTLTVYIDKLVAGEPLEIPIIYKAAFAARAAPAPSKAYDYYDDAIEATDEGEPISIFDQDAEFAFIRGDANSDGLVDLSDAVAVLDFLFLGAGKSACDDALDANDDGEVNISDPIAILFHLFAGGAPPADPYPGPGEDPTEDSLRCAID